MADQPRLPHDLLFDRERVASLFFDGPGGMPIHLVGEGQSPPLDAAAMRWLKDTAFMPAAKKQALLPAPDGSLAAVVLGLGNGMAGEPSGPSELLLGQLAAALPPRDYRLGEVSPATAHLAALAWGLGAYRFKRYRTATASGSSATSNGNGADGLVRLAWPDDVDRERILAEIEAIHAGRDLINTPASDLAPEDIEHAVRALAARHGAGLSVIAGDDLLKRNFPLVHAVGRASPRAPRLIDLTWGDQGARKVTLVGKGIVFDTGGLDIKSSSAMLLMKKDMGGAAVALALAHMIMATRLPVRLRVIIAAAENSISGNAFRPGDVIASRLGPTVEIGNTDAEGRLVLADALALADEEAPHTLLAFSTLTGAARVALGPDLPALFTDNDGFAARLTAAGVAVGDPVWRLPLWSGYERGLDSEVADLCNVSESPFNGAITAALFLRRFVKSAHCFAHVDLYGWRQAPRPLGPKGGEPQSARAVFEVLRQEGATP